MNVAVVKYNAGNIFSVLGALKRLGVNPVLTDDAETLLGADRVLFPGQGEASNAMRYLKARGLDRVICDLKAPMLGICIGQQLMCRHSEEGDVDCLGLFDAEVKHFHPRRHEDKVPHMGWNSLRFNSSNESQRGDGGLFKGLRDGDYVYFVHSYYVPLCPETIASTDFIQPFSSALHKGNFWATQFHPEKSGRVGEQIIKNFLEL